MANRTCSIEGCEGVVLVQCRGWCGKHYQRWQKHGDPLKLVLDKELPAIVRYEAKIDRTTTPDGCHPWTAGRSGGYGVLRADGRNWHAHRWGYLNLVGDIPEGLCVCHHCDNPLCQNRLHWFLGTRSENNADKVAKGRQSRLQGTAHPMAKLTEQDVRLIRELYASGRFSMRQIAAFYEVTRPTVGYIISRKHWAHVA